MILMGFSVAQDRRPSTIALLVMAPVLIILVIATFAFYNAGEMAVIVAGVLLLPDILLVWMMSALALGLNNQKRGAAGFATVLVTIAWLIDALILLSLISAGETAAGVPSDSVVQPTSGIVFGIACRIVSVLIVRYYARLYRAWAR